MELLVTERSMSARRRKSGPEKPGRDDKAVKVDRALADKAAYVAARRGLTLAEYLTEMIRKPVERDFAKETEVTN